jgi:hypothetical protein
MRQPACSLPRSCRQVIVTGRSLARVQQTAAQLALRPIPSGMAVYTVSPGSTPDTLGLRNEGGVFKWLLLPMVKLLPGMSHTPQTAARRYLQAEFGTDVSGQFFASAPKKVTGPIEAMRHPHFHGRANQEAAWQAVVKVAGVDLSSVAPFGAVS